MKLTRRAYQLRPGGGAPDPEHAARIRAGWPRLREMAEGLGVEVAEAQPRLGVDTRLAHEGAKFVATSAPGQADAYHRALYRAHFVLGRDLADLDTLTAIASGLGLDGAAFRAALERGDHRAAVLAEDAAARAVGVRGVPQLFVGGVPLPPGLSRYEALVAAVDQAGG